MTAIHKSYFLAAPNILLSLAAALLIVIDISCLGSIPHWMISPVLILSGVVLLFYVIVASIMFWLSTRFCHHHANDYMAVRIVYRSQVMLVGNLAFATIIPLSEVNILFGALLAPTVGMIARYLRKR